MTNNRTQKQKEPVLYIEAICPYCNLAFKPENILDTHQSSSCNCGAMFCLCAEDDEMETREEILNEYPVARIHALPNFDALSDSPNDPPDTHVTALFWKV